MGKEEVLKYINKTFTEEGINALYKYTQELVKIWYKKEENEYPFTIGIVYGLPFFDDTANDRKINNKDQLEGRIRGFMQLMCLKSIEVPHGAMKIKFTI